MPEEKPDTLSTRDLYVEYTRELELVDVGAACGDRADAFSRVEQEKGSIQRAREAGG